MKFQFIAAALSAASIALIPSISHAETLQQCLDNAAANRREDAKIVGQAAADLTWVNAVNECKRSFGR